MTHVPSAVLASPFVAPLQIVPWRSWLAAIGRPRGQSAIRRLVPSLMTMAGVVGTLAALPTSVLAQTTVVWRGQNGYWSDATKWNPSTYYPNNGNGGLIFDASVTAGQATLTENITLRNLTVDTTGTIINGAYDLTLTGDLTWNRGTLSGVGTVSVGAGHGFTLSNSTYLASGRTLASAGTGSITGTLYLNGASTLENSGALTVGYNASIKSQDSSSSTRNRIINSGTMTLAPNSSIVGAGNIDIVNTGTLQKIDGANAATVSASVDNTGGNILVSAGTLTLSGGGQMAGTYSTVGDYAYLGLSGNYTYAGGSFSGKNITFTSGTIYLDGVVDALLDALHLTGGTLSGAFSTAGALNLEGAALNGSATVGGALKWSSGTISNGTLTNTSSATVSGTVYLSSGATYANSGTTTQSGIVNLNSATARVTNSGTWTLADSTAIQDYNGYTGKGVVNTGTVQKTSGNGTASIGTAFDNAAGTVAVSTGTLNLYGGGVVGGSYTTTGTGNISFTGGSFTYAPATFSGNNIKFTNGTLNLDGVSNANLTNLHLTGGTVAGTFSTSGDFSLEGATLTGVADVAGAFKWTGGTISGAGTQTIATGHTLTQSGTTYVSNSRTLANAGTATLSGTVYVQNGATYANSGTTTQSGIVNLNSATARVTNSGTWTLADSTAIQDYNGYTGKGVVNTGLVQKTAGNGAANITTAFDNTGGTVAVSAGTLNFNSGGVVGGSYQTLGTGNISFTGGSFTYAPATFSGNNIKFTSGTLNLDGVSNANLTNLHLTGGTVAGTFSTSGDFSLEGATLTGLADVAGAFKWTGGTISGAGTQTIATGHTLTQSGTTNLSSSRTLANAGSATVSGTVYLNGGATYANSGTTTLSGSMVRYDSASKVTNSGTMTMADNASISYYNYNYATVGFVNTGLVQKTAGSGTAGISTAFDNAAGTVAVSSGTLYIGSTPQVSGGAILGGTWSVGGTGTLTLGVTTAITSNAGHLILNGASANLTGLGSLASNSGTIDLLGSRNLGSSTFANSGTVTLAGGTISSTSFTNQTGGTVSGYGSFASRVTSQGTLAASGGTLTLANGVAGGAGSTLTVANNGALSLAGGTAGSTTDYLVHNGSTAGSLALGTNSVTVAVDYQNASAGSGNSYNARANVSGTGGILAAGNTAQTITGDVVGGTTATPRLADFGAIHEGGSVSRTYTINNAGTTGPVLRGAIQTSAGGGNITDARLSGSGVTAQNYGALAAGESSGTYTVTLNGTTAGAVAAGQKIAVVNNYDNVANQVVTVGSGAVYRLASASSLPTNTINLGNYHEGAAAQVSLSISNTAGSTGGYTETLAGAVASATGHASGSGSFTGLGVGDGPSTALRAAVDTSTAGARSGSVTYRLTSQEVNSSGLGNTALASQTVNVTAGVYRLAAASVAEPVAVNLGIVHVGDSLQHNIHITNTAGDTGGYTETLRASASGLTGFSGLAAGQTGTMTYTADTSASGRFSREANIVLASQAVGGSGLGETAVGGTNVQMNYQVNNFAALGVAKIGGDGTLTYTSANSATFDFGTVSLGSGASALAAQLALSNVATGMADSLAISYGGANGRFTLQSFDAVAGVDSGESVITGVLFNPNQVGTWTETLTVYLRSQNESGYDGALTSFTLTISGNTTAASAVPEPATNALLAGLAALVGAYFWRSRKSGAAKARE